MTDIAFAPAKLPVIATFKKAFQVSLKSGGRILLFSMLFLAVYFAAALIVGLLAGLVGIVVAERLNLDPGSPGFILAILAVAVPGFLAILVIAFRFSFGLTRLADAIAAHLPLKLEQKQDILEMGAVAKRLEHLLGLLARELGHQPPCAVTMQQERLARRIHKLPLPRLDL